jgi:hypothetical protein
VLDRPEIPLHTNGSERDIRCCVTKRKISDETRADAGKQARDTFLSLLKTCSKLAVSFWDYLGARLKIPDANAVPLASRSRPAEGHRVELLRDHATRLPGISDRVPSRGAFSRLRLGW